MVVALPLVVVDMVKSEVSVPIRHEIVVVIAVKDARVATVDAVLVVGVSIVFVVVVIATVVEAALVLHCAPMETTRRGREGVVRDVTRLVYSNELNLVRLIAGR
jgi:hypothetical protein